jgi:regulator of protease activity HflC (stomatin/prohibitin superfamily)
MADDVFAGAVCGFLPIVAIVGFFLIIAGIRIIYQYERGIVFTLGKYAGTRGPGLNIVIPVFQTMQKVDTRIKTIDIPKQEVMTKDNVPVMVNAVVYFKVDKPEAAVLEIEDYTYAVAQYAQTALRDVVGNSGLDFVLTEREKVADSIQTIVDKETESWGVDITAIKIQDIELPADMKRAMARQAEAEREKRGMIIMSEGELAASANLAEAAKKLSQTAGALHLRTLQTITDVSADEGNTVIFVTPIELLRAIEGWGKNKGKDI